MGERDQVNNVSTGTALTRNGADDVDVESFELQRFLKLASDMQTIPVKMLFVGDRGGPEHPEGCLGTVKTTIWKQIRANRHKILNRNTKSVRWIL